VAGVAKAAALALIASPVAAFDARVGWGPVPNVAGYRLYLRQTGQPYGAGVDVGLVQPVSGVVHYVARGLPPGITNVFAVTSYDVLGRESGRSNELTLLFGAAPASTATPPRTPSVTAPAAARTPTRQALQSTATRTATLEPATTGTRVFTPTSTPLTKRRVRFRRVRASQGTMVTVPVKISAGSGVRFVTLTATFDPDVVAVGWVDLSADAGPGSISANIATPGNLSVAASLAQPMTDRGVLLDVSFEAVGPCKSETDVLITSCVLDGGAVGCRPRDGRVKVRCR
jgi:hypothetical protein